MRPGQKATTWIETYCVYPHGFNKGQHVRLTEQQREIVLRIFDTNEPPGEISAPLSAYLALFHVAGPRDLAAHVSQLQLSADFFSVWNATGPDLKSFLKPDGEQVVCVELGTRFPPVAA